MQPTARGVHYGISAFSVSLLMNCKVFPSADEAEAGRLFRVHFFFFVEVAPSVLERTGKLLKHGPDLLSRAGQLICLAGWQGEVYV